MPAWRSQPASLRLEELPPALLCRRRCCVRPGAQFAVCSVLAVQVFEFLDGAFCDQLELIVVADGYTNMAAVRQ